MTLVALKDLPNGVKAGESFNDNPIRGEILIRLGLAQSTDPPKVTRPRQTYRRRDLRADDSSS